MLVLIVDLGLAAAGAALLMKGLAGKQASEAKGAPPAETATERKSEVLPPAAIDGIATAPAAAVADNIGAVADNGAVGDIGAVADNGAVARVAAVDRVAGAAPAAASDLAARPAPAGASGAPRAATAATSDARTATTRETVAARTASTKAGKPSASTPVASKPASAAVASKSGSAAVASAATKSATSSAGASAATKSAAGGTGASAATKSATSSTGANATSSADATRVTSVPSAPQDPYPDPEREIDAAAARSKPAFARCASNHGPAHGAIQIAFQVRSDGKIANAAAVENSTGNSELARCLVAEIASWRVSAHGGATIDMFRPFTYP
jgi:hypothetical protein